MNTNALRTCAALLILSACSVDPIIGTRDEGVSEIDGDAGDGADGTPGDGADGTPSDGSDGSVGDGSDGSTGELPSCDRGFLSGENSCTVCCIVDGDILDWCEDLPCTACVEGDLEIEPGATKHNACNTCLCNRDGSVTCTQEDCDVDCDAEACPWRTASAYHVQYDRGDGFTLYHSDFEGFWLNGPNGGVSLEQAQVQELVALLAAPALRDFVRNGTGACPAIDGYWNDLRSGEQAAWKTRFSLTLEPASGPAEQYTRVLTGDCQVPALAPLDAFLERVAP